MVTREKKTEINRKFKFKNVFKNKSKEKCQRKKQNKILK